MAVGKKIILRMAEKSDSAISEADRIWAARYNPGDVLRYSRGSKETGIGKGEYARVKSVDAPNNRLTVERKDGTEQSYDPGVSSGYV